MNEVNFDGDRIGYDFEEPRVLEYLTLPLDPYDLKSTPQDNHQALGSNSPTPISIPELQFSQPSDLLHDLKSTPKDNHLAIGSSSLTLIRDREVQSSQAAPMHRKYSMFPLTITLDFKLGRLRRNSRFDTNGVTSAILRKLGKPGLFPRAYKLMLDTMSTSRISCTPALRFFNEIHTLQPPPDQDIIEEYYTLRACFRAVLNKYFNLTGNQSMKKTLTPTPGEDDIMLYEVDARLDGKIITIRRVPHDTATSSCQKRKIHPPLDSKQVEETHTFSAPTGPSQRGVKRVRNLSTVDGPKGVRVVLVLHLPPLCKVDNEDLVFNSIYDEMNTIKKKLDTMLDLKIIEAKHGVNNKPEIVFPKIITESHGHLEGRFQSGGKGQRKISLSFTFHEESFYRNNQRDFKRCMELEHLCEDVLKSLGFKWSNVCSESGSIVCTFVMTASELGRALELKGVMLDEFKKLLINKKIKCIPTVSTTSIAQVENNWRNETQVPPRKASVRIEATFIAAVHIVNKLLDLNDWKTEELYIQNIHAFPMHPYPLTNKDQRLGDCLPAIQDLIRTLRGVFIDPSSSLVSEIVAHIVEYWAFEGPPPMVNYRRFFEAASKGSLEEIKGFIRDHPGLNLNQKDSNGRTALHIACKNGDHAIVRVLVDSKANLEARERQGNTALQIACRKGDLEVTEFLVESKAQLDCSNNEGKAALLTSCRCGNLEVARYMVEAGENAKVSDTNGYGPLHLLVQRNPPTVKFWIEKAKSGVSTPNIHGFTPLLAACSKGHLPLVRFLVEAKADMKYVDRLGYIRTNTPCQQ